jgi:glycosyltransferase involved in cell wall biosynthesis
MSIEFQSHVGVFHPGTQHSWQTARALQDIGDLGWYATSIFHVHDRWPYNVANYLPDRLRVAALAEFRRFYHPDLDPKFVHTAGAAEWAMRICTRLGWRKFAAVIHRYNNQAFARPVRRLIRRVPVRAVWGYDFSSLEVFEYARSRGISRILDRTIGHPAAYNALMENVYAEYSEFFLSSQFRIGQDLVDRADREHDGADVVLVGSEYCRSTLLEAQNKPTLESKIKILKYCFDDYFFGIRPHREPKRGGPLNFLFMGQAGPRKGIHLALKVFKRIPKAAATLAIVGDLQVPPDTFARYQDRVTLYRTVARADVAQFMERADCLIFPSYFEGAGLVLYEAMASGLGIIQSKNADVVVDDGFGLLMNELNESELERCVMTVVENPCLLDEWRPHGYKRVTSFTFDAYRDRVAGVVRNI